MGAGIGAGLGVLVALLWGTADILVTLSARHIGTTRTTLISQIAGMIALLLCGCLLLLFWRYSLSFSLLTKSVFIGALTGFCAACGYYAFYNALELGPIALVSPITASSSSFTFLLSILVHREQTSLSRISCIVIVIIGVVLASTNAREPGDLFRAQKPSSFKRGIYLAIVAMVAFGLMDFGIGVSASISDWFLPVLWTRLFSFTFVTLFLSTQRSRIGNFRNWKSFVAPNEDSFSYPHSRYTTVYQPFVRFADPRFLADFPTLILNSSANTRIDARPSSLRRVTMLPLAHPSPPMPEHYAHHHTIPEIRPNQDSGNKEPVKTWKNLWISLTVLSGILENIAILIFSFDTRVTTIGFTSAIASSYSLIGTLFGVLFYQERLEKVQLYGIVLCISGIFLLAA
jgi:drug/metabolite transporter (DMT)-like permease